MTPTKRTVFVLGAGFTRAFVPQAPLLVDDYDAEKLLKKYREFPHACRILRSELKINSDGKINIERLMTRLDGGMPYDNTHGADNELNLLLSDLKRSFTEKIKNAKKSETHTGELGNFAEYCINRGISCISFNYDDILDEALWTVEKARSSIERPYWHPDGGYGFFCRPSESCVSDISVFMDSLSEHHKMLLLKLHGSINWYIKRGHSKPHSIDAVVHHEQWFPPSDEEEIDGSAIPLHLENDPFIVPPVLSKSTLMDQPILKVVWSLAYDKLANAEEVVFIGYSFPLTDIASSFIFRESLKHLPQTNIKIVNCTTTAEQEATIKLSYKNIFPDLLDEQFDFNGALEWSQELSTPEANDTEKNK